MEHFDGLVDAEAGRFVPGGNFEIPMSSPQMTRMFGFPSGTWAPS
jgi:hypothetical protein